MIYSEKGQQGTNRCGTSANQTSMCQNAYSKSHCSSLRIQNLISFSVNSVDDFCLWAPPEPGKGSTIGDTEVRVLLLQLGKY